MLFTNDIDLTSEIITGDHNYSCENKSWDIKVLFSRTKIEK